MILELLAGAGLFLSVYASYVEYKIEVQKKYAPLCDIRDHISCSKAFTSKYSKAAGVSNAHAGIVFYALLLGILWPRNEVIINTAIVLGKIAAGMILAANIGQLYLMYVSYFILRNFCLVCNSIYVVNIALLVALYLGF